MPVPQSILQSHFDSARYAKAVEVSKRVRWDIDKDVIRGRSFDFGKRIITVRGKPVHLTPKEFDLLREMVAHHDTPIPHRRLLQAVWGPDYGDETEYLRVIINQLRKKIEINPAKPKYILTEPWVGYRLVLPADSRVEESAKGAEA